MRRLIWLALLLASFPAMANYQPTVTGGLASHSTVALTTAALQLLSADANRKFVLVENISDVNISCSWTSASPTSGGVGTILLLPGGSQTFETSYITTQALYCISSGGSGKGVTVLTAP